MEFSFYVTKVFPPDEEGFVTLHGKDFSSKQTSYPSYSTQKTTTSPLEENMKEILDKMGVASSKAQGLKSVITDYSRFITSDHRLYLKVESKAALGLLKVGVKNLFHHDSLGNVRELKPLCVLDFYVHESVQRMGLGKILFDKMLEVEKSAAHCIAYDRPSPKLIWFLKKHYGLSDYIPQNNNFVIFRQYFDKKGADSQSTDKAIGRRDGTVPIPTETTNPLLGGSLKKPAQIDNQMKTQAEFYRGRQGGNDPTGKIGAKSQFPDFPVYTDQNVQLEKQPRASTANKQRQQQRTDPLNQGYNGAWEEPNMEKSSKAYYQESKSDSKKLTKQERDYIDIEKKLKRTEEDIDKCKEKIEELSKQKITPKTEDAFKSGNIDLKGKEDMNGGGESKPRIQGSNRSTPWATHHDIVTRPSSSAYGSYLTKKY